MQSATTRAKQQRASDNTQLAMRELTLRLTLLVGNTTGGDRVHHGIARRLVRDGRAEWATYEDHGTWRDMGRIVLKGTPTEGHPLSSSAQYGVKVRS